MFISDSKEPSLTYIPEDLGKIASLPREQREEELQAAKERLLTSPTVPVSENQFLLLHGDTFLGNSLYRGGNIFDNVGYILAELKEARSESGPLQWGLSAEECNEWIEDCIDIQESSKCWSSKGSLGAVRCIDFINSRLDFRNREPLDKNT